MSCRDDEDFATAAPRLETRLFRGPGAPLDEDDALSRATTPVVAPPPVVVPPPAPPAASAEPNLLDLDFAATPPSN